MGRSQRSWNAGQSWGAVPPSKLVVVLSAASMQQVGFAGVQGVPMDHTVAQVSHLHLYQTGSALDETPSGPCRQCHQKAGPHLEHKGRPCCACCYRLLWARSLHHSSSYLCSLAWSSTRGRPVLTSRSLPKHFVICILAACCCCLCYLSTSMLHAAHLQYAQHLRFCSMQHFGFPPVPCRALVPFKPLPF